MAKQTRFFLAISISIIAVIIFHLNQNRPVTAQTLSLWQIETVNATGSCFNTSISLILNDEGMAHISYQDMTRPALLHSYQSNTGWVNEVVDNTSGGVAYSSIALDSLGYPHISYRDDTIKYAHWDGSAWQITSIGPNEDGSHTSLALDENDQAHISYLGNGIKYAFWNGDQWEISVIDEIYSDSGTSLVLDSLGSPHVSYHKFREVRYAVYSNTHWITETVEIQEADDIIAGLYSSIALDDTDSPHISYSLYDTHNIFLLISPSNLKYAKKYTDTWIVETVVEPDQVGTYSSLALDKQNQPHISYFDADNKTMKYAHWNGTSWGLRLVETPVQMDGYTSIQLDQNGQPHIAYCDEQDNAIKYAHLVGVKSQVYLPLLIK